MSPEVALKEQHVLNAIRLIAKAWEQVTPETIQNCWRHVGLTEELHTLFDQALDHAYSKLGFGPADASITTSVLSSEKNRFQENDNAQNNGSNGVETVSSHAENGYAPDYTSQQSGMNGVSPSQPNESITTQNSNEPPPSPDTMTAESTTQSK